MKIKGVHLPGNKDAQVKEWEISDPDKDEVLVEIKASALCASDLSIYYGKPLIPGFPAGTFIPGHEPCGVIHKTGSCVKNLKEGDRVAIICFVGCGFCRYCRSGEPNLCSSTGVLGFTRHGGDAEFLVVPEKVCLPMPDDMSYVAGAISTDAIGNLYATMKEMNVYGDDLVAITGLGPMGLSGILAAKAMGATVVAIDPVIDRLNKAKEMGADYVMNPQDGNPEQKLKEISPGGVDKAVDCSAAENAINLLLNVTRPHGVVAQIGEPGEKMIAINPSEQLIRKKLAYIGSWYFRLDEWDDIADLIVNRIGNDKAESIVSHRYPLDNDSASEAFRLFSEHKTLKVVFTP